MSKPNLFLLLGLLVILRTASPTAAPARTLPFSCDVFSPRTSATKLAARFGAANLTTAMVNWGEGDVSPATVLFADDAEARLEIHWSDERNQRNPDAVRVREDKTRWTSPAGITIGTTLRTLERLNGRPFRLAGFAFDWAGTVTTWSGGRLGARRGADCLVAVRLNPRPESNRDGRLKGLAEQVDGDKIFSSRHPAMQALNPSVYELLIDYDPQPR
jgi:hypothetical protein